MIKFEEVFKIGIINKPHGVKGEVSFTFTDDIFDRVDCNYLICCLDGILVPFFIEEYRFRSDTSALIKFEGISNAEQAKKLTNTEVFFHKKYVDEEDTDTIPSWAFFSGFTVIDRTFGLLGTIEYVDESTMNVFFVITNESGKEILLPAHEEFITKIDKKDRTVYVSIPDGLLE